MELFNDKLADAIKFGGLPMKSICKPLLSGSTIGVLNVSQSIANGSLQENGLVTGYLYYDIEIPDTIIISFVLKALLACKEAGVVFDDDIETLLRNACDSDDEGWREGGFYSQNIYWSDVIDLAQHILYI